MTNDSLNVQQLGEMNHLEGIDNDDTSPIVASEDLVGDDEYEMRELDGQMIKVAKKALKIHVLYCIG